MAELILASGSPRRRELLSGFGLPFEVVPADIDESTRSGESARDYVLRMALEKAEAVAGRYPGHAVLAADTAVVVDSTILGKPGSEDEARDMLERLSGRVHQVMTALALFAPRQRPRQILSVTDVHFADLPASWIESYTASGDPLDKAGAYGIQNEAGLWVRRIDGSHSGVIGLPLYETGELLRAAGLLES